MLDNLKRGDRRFYTLYTAVVMPEHVHLLLKPSEQFELSRVMKGIKGCTARRINLLRETRGSIWQDESYDRIVRDEDEFLQKLQYALDNPVKAGLADDPLDDEFCYYDEEACFGQ